MVALVVGGFYNVAFWYVTNGMVTYPDIPRTWLTWIGVPTLAMVWTTVEDGGVLQRTTWTALAVAWN